jgi:hypothetical protein
MGISAAAKARLAKLNKARKNIYAEVTPSTKLACVNVHKIQDKMSCDRMYFWKWVLNLVPKRMSVPFWFGTVMHRGNEELAFDKKPGSAKCIANMEKVMRAESKKIISQYSLEAEVNEEVNVQLEIAVLMMKVYVELYKDTFSDFKTKHTEIAFRKPLKQSPVILVGRLDATGEYLGMPAIKEYKTASRVNNEYFQRLIFDKQLNGYAIGHKKMFGMYPQVCPYTVFHKPAIRVRQNETVPEFLMRLEEDLHMRQDWYYIKQDIRFKKKAIKATLMDIEWAVFDLYSKYGFLSKEQILNPFNWPRNDSACFNYGVCPYFFLCRNCYNYKLYLSFYQMREIRYEEEKAELDRKFAIPVSKISTVDFELTEEER